MQQRVASAATDAKTPAALNVAASQSNSPIHLGAKSVSSSPSQAPVTRNLVYAAAAFITV